MLRGPPLLAIAFALTWLRPEAAGAQGLSGRIGHVIAVEGEDLVVRVELEGLLDSVGKVLVDMRPLGALNWHTREALRETQGSWWSATFTSSVVPARLDAEHRQRIEVRARVLGSRGGTMLEIGADEPLEAEVMQPREARAIARELTKNVAEEGGGLELVGHVGADARAGTSGRVRALVGVGGRPSARSEIVAAVTVGPQFSPPSLLQGGGPMVLGFEAGVRLYARDPAVDIVALFVEPGLGVDLRFPGADPGIGLHAGAAFRVWSQVAVEASLGGLFVAFRAFDSEHRSTVGGATGGIRIALRFGGVRENR